MALVFNSGPECLQCRFYHAEHRNARPPQRDSAVGQTLQVEQVVDHLCQIVELANEDSSCKAFRALIALMMLEKLHTVPHRAQRIAKFMCKCREKQILVAVGLPRRLLGNPSCRYIAVDFENDRRLIGPPPMQNPVACENQPLSVFSGVDQLSLPLAMLLELGIQLGTRAGKYS